jgi:hypothetical protein
MINFRVLSTVRRYAGKIRTLRNEARTERLLNSLPPHMRADIGWPDRRAELWPRG